jgi:hypothetical protein
MDFAKIYPWAILPDPNKDQPLIIRAPHDIDIPPNQIFLIELGLMLFKIPLNTIIKLYTVTNFKILVKFWLPSCNLLNIPVITNKPLHINMGEPLCQIHLISIMDLLPGKKNLFLTIRNSNKIKTKNKVFTINYFNNKNT